MIPSLQAPCRAFSNKLCIGADSTNLNVYSMMLINSDVNPHSFDLNIIEGTDKAGNLLIPFGVDSVFSIPGSLGIENAIESILLYPNLIS